MKERLKKQKQRLQRKQEKQSKLTPKDKQTSSSDRKPRNKSASAATVRKRAQRLKKALPLKSDEWAGTLNHDITTVTPRRSLVKATFSEDDRRDDSIGIDSVVGTRKVGRLTTSAANVKRKLAYTCKAKELWKSPKHLNQFKRRQMKQKTSSSRQLYSNKHGNL